MPSCTYKKEFYFLIEYIDCIITEKVRQMSLDMGETKRNDQSRQGLGQEIQVTLL